MSALAFATLLLLVVGILVAEQVHAMGMPRPVAAIVGTIAIFRTWWFERSAFLAQDDGSWPAEGRGRSDG